MGIWSVEVSGLLRVCAIGLGVELPGGNAIDRGNVSGMALRSSPERGRASVLLAIVR